MGTRGTILCVLSPSTGSVGTAVFSASGLVMALAVSIILISRRRADAE